MLLLTIVSSLHDMPLMVIILMTGSNEISADLASH